MKEGDAVNAGDILVELDPTLTGADQTQTKGQKLALELDRARIQTILDKVDGKEQKDYFTGLNEATPAQIKLQKERISKQLNEYYSLLEALKDEKKQRQAERGAITDRIEQLDATIPLITERAKSLQELLETSMVPRVQWLELEQERIEQVKERDVQRNNSRMVVAAIANIRQRQIAQKAEFEKTLLNEL